MPISSRGGSNLPVLCDASSIHLVQLQLSNLLFIVSTRSFNLLIDEKPGGSVPLASVVLAAASRAETARA
jgi:hypothetical protein